MKRCLILGVAGQIGVHLVKRLKADGCFVTALDRKPPEYGWPGGEPDVFWTADLRANNRLLLSEPYDEIYQLAAEVGGLGYIMNRENDAEILHNSMQINLSVLEAVRRSKRKPRLFFASSACVYPTLSSNLGALRSCSEYSAWPYQGDNAYAHEKMFAEFLYDAYARNYGIPVRIGRLHNTYGPYGTWKGGREKAPAAICRKVAEARNHSTIEIWGDGKATRSFTYVDDTVEGIVRLTRSDFQGPVNIGSSEMVTINELVRRVCAVAGKQLLTVHVDGPVGVAGRNSDNALIRVKLGWEPKIGLDDGLAKLYPWIANQVNLTKTTAGVI